MTRRLSGLCLACILALATGGCPDVLVSSNPTVTLTVDSTSIDAATGVATVTATLSSISMQPVEVALDFGGTAVSGITYTRSATTITIPSYATAGSITVRGAGGSAYDPDANVTVAIASVTNGTAAAGQEPLSIAITGNAAQPTVSLSLPASSALFAKDGGTVDVTATLSNLSSQDVTVNLAFAGTAVNVTDYTRSADAIVVPAGKKTGKITLTGVKQDAFVNHKSVIVSIGSVVNGIVTASTSGQNVTAYLQDTSVTLPTATLALDKTEISAAGGVATLTCTLDKTIPVDATIQFVLGTSTTGKYGKNFTISNKTESATGTYWLLTVPAGQTTGSITITGMQRSQYLGDVLVVLNATSVVNLTGSGTSTFTVTIQDTIPVPQITLDVAGSPISENNGVATVTATLPTALPLDTTVNLSFSGATLDTDYKVSGQTISIPSGQLSNSVQVTAIPNPAYTGDKTITVKVDSVTIGANNTPQSSLQQGTVVITDAQSQPTVSLSISSDLLYQANGVAQVTAKLSTANANSDVTVPLNFAGTAVQGADKDYTASATSITITKGFTQGAITLRTVNNSTNRVGNTVIVSLGTLTGATAGTPSSVTATLTDVSVSLAMTGSPIAENGGVATVTATLIKTISSDVTLNFGLGGTAVKDADYTISDTKIVIPAGQTTGTLTLMGKENYTYDNPAKTINISTQKVQNAAVVDTSQFTVTIADDYTQAGVRWLADNATKPGVTVTASGLQYKILTVGTGALPTATDKVTVNYVGTLINGTQFDANNGTQFTVNGVIAGWTEALQLMPVGSRWMLYIPANLGYGTTSQTNIPAGSVLIFDVTLLSIP